MNNKTKKNIVKMLLNQKYDDDHEQNLIETLIEEPISVNIDKIEDTNITFGEKLSDKIATIAGSWTFVICFIIFILGWIFLNLTGIITLDRYPFILLNLVLSCIAALQAPIIMMSQNRASKKDSLRGFNDYKIDLKSELILEVLHEQIKELNDNQKKILKYLEENK